MAYRPEAGASARADGERRHGTRDRRGRVAPPGAGGPALAVTDAPRATRHWDVGPATEERIGHLLAAVPGTGVLHDRVAPGGVGWDLDHVVITTSGILVVDTKANRGRVDVSRNKLRVGGRDQTKLVRAALDRAATVHRVVPLVPVRGCLCFVDGDFALFGPTRCRDVAVVSVRGLVRLVKRMSHDHRVDVDAVTNRLASALPPAAGRPDAG